MKLKNLKIKNLNVKNIKVKLALIGVIATILISGYILNTPNSIKIASWNIENFGQSKASDPARMKIIADIIKDYDLIAIQEISNVMEMSDQGCPRNEGKCPDHKNCNIIRNALEQYLNEELGLNYEFVFSPQVKDERYLFIYNPDKITLEGEPALVNDETDSIPICNTSPSSTGKVVRQPFKAKFKAGNFDFILLTAHTQPSNNVRELEGLEYFYKEAEIEEPDVILLGDLNADCNYLRASHDVRLKGSEYIWVIDNDQDTTVAATHCAYDRFIFKEPTSENYTGNSGIYTEVPENVSDHYLVWAEFSTATDSD